MEFGSRSVIRRTNKKQDTSNVLQDSSNIQHVTIVVDETDNYNLSFYNQPPSEVITVEEFQKLGMERMNVLRELESLKEKYAADPRKYLEQFIEVNLLNKLRFLCYLGGVGKLQILGSWTN